MKILDFGLAKLTAVGIDREEVTASSPTKPGVLMGTVAYMSPEQVQARPVDARSDLFSFGVVLYEMLARKHPFRRETVAATLTAILQETPSQLTVVDASIPPAVDGIVRRCLEKGREERFQGAHDLSLALEAVLAAPTGSAFLQEVEERSPYPGLMSFTEKEAGVFFGRESEVKALWERIRGRRLLAVIGPSGVGKTSFLRAGVLPSRPEGWTALVCTPGTTPFRGLGQALGPALAGDAEALGQLAGFEDPETALALLSRWRRSHAEALVVVDQFEELFTSSGGSPGRARGAAGALRPGQQARSGGPQPPRQQSHGGSRLCAQEPRYRRQRRGPAARRRGTLAGAGGPHRASPASQLESCLEPGRPVAGGLHVLRQGAAVPRRGWDTHCSRWLLDTQRRP
jgi:hypothetical protein